MIAGSTLSAVSGGVATARAGSALAGLQLALRDQAGAERQLDRRVQPLLVVAHAQVVGRRQASRCCGGRRRCSSAARRRARGAAASTRPSHGAWNTGSFGSGSTGPKPCMPPMSWTPFMAPPAPWPWYADHGVARDQRGQFLLAQAVGAGRPLGQHEVADLGGAVPDPHLDVVGHDDSAELAQHAARIDHGARAVGRRLVPDRRQAQHRPRVAGAERADDEVVDGGRVLDHDHVLALRAGVAELGDRGGGVRAAAAPCRRDRSRRARRPGAVARPDLVLVGVDRARRAPPDRPGPSRPAAIRAP